MNRQAGFSYVVAMFGVAMLAVLATKSVENAQTKERRAREEDLLFVGQAFRTAIKRYYEGSPGFIKSYPPNLEALLLDARSTRTSRPLRKLYPDPMSGAPWGVVVAPDGGVMGVFSMSRQKPFKQDGFPVELAGLASSKQYQDWKFIYQPH